MSKVAGRCIFLNISNIITAAPQLEIGVAEQRTQYLIYREQYTQQHHLNPFDVNLLKLFFVS